MYHELIDLWKDLLKTGLREDGLPWDWTSLGLKSIRIQGRVMAKSKGIWAASTLARTLPKLAPGVSIQVQIEDGAEFKPGDCLVLIEGLSHEVLALERPFLNLAAYVSGIATRTSALVKQVKKSCPENPPRVTLTRKTLPGYRDLAILGVRLGGGYPHRVSLSGGVLIKENHIVAAGGIAAAAASARQVAPHGLKIEMEVRSEKELQEALQAHVDVVLLDNFSPEQVKSALLFIQTLDRKPVIEVSGGITEENIATYSIPGVDVLSVGSLTHSVKSVDLSLLVD